HLAAPPPSSSTAASTPAFSTLSLHDALPILLALPIVPQATSFPWSENFSPARPLTFLYILEAWARPRSLGICPAVQDISALLFRSEEHTSELQSRENLVCRLLLEKKNKTQNK